jgi:hypothetical protein
MVCISVNTEDGIAQSLSVLGSGVEDQENRPQDARTSVPAGKAIGTR